MLPTKTRGIVSWGGEGMIRRILLFFSLLCPLTLTACQTWSPTKITDKASIPDQAYDISVYKDVWRPYSYAVLLDIPDDGTRVVMYHTMYVRRVGLGSPGEYINLFETRIKAHRTLEIHDRGGNLRGYLLIYKVLSYEIRERPGEERIVVYVGGRALTDSVRTRE
jgi:hypothetical protein